MTAKKSPAEKSPVQISGRLEALQALPHLDALDLIENLGTGVCLTDRDDTFVYVNSCFAAMLGYSAPELVGKCLYDCVLFDKDIPLVKEKNIRRLSGLSEQYELQGRCKDGSPVWGLVTAAPLFSSDGSIVGTVASVTDITSQRRILDTLEHQRTFLRHVIDTSPNLIFSRDLNGHYTLVNKAMADDHGMLPEEMIGLSISDTIRDEAQRKRIEEEDRRVIEKRQIHFERDTVIPHKITGELRHFQVLKMPLVRAESEAPQVLGILTDFTREHRLQSLLHDIVEATASVTADDFFHSLVQHLAGALGTKWAFVGKISERSTTHVQMLAFWDQNHFREKLEYAISDTPSETVIGQEVRVYPTGARKLFPHDPSMIKNDVESYIGAPLFDSNGRSLGILAVMHDRQLADMDEKKSIMRLFAARAGAELERLRNEKENQLLQRQLMQSQKMEAIGQMVAGIAHDLNNALGAISGHLQLLEISPELSPSLRHSVEVASKGTERAGSLIEHLLQFSRKSDPHQQVVSLPEAVTETLEFLGRIIPENVKVSCSGPGRMQNIMANPAELQQMLTNLVINACQAMSGGGNIYFSFSTAYVENPQRFNPVTRTGVFTTLTLRDTGMGIARENLDKIFDPFFTTKKDDGGTGLGLAMVYAAMQRHGGWVEADSRLGSGTAFRLYFPSLEETAAPAKPTQAHTERVSGNILVVDDDAFLVDLTRKFLEMSGFPVFGFTRPAEALTWFQENPSQAGLAILDMKMPGMEGLECAARLHEINPEIKVIMLSGTSVEVSQTQLSSCGILKILQKPLRYPELVKFIADTLVNPANRKGF